MLDMFFAPQSVAVIGASRTPGKIGFGVLQNIVQHGYQGAIYPINPNADEVLGLKCYPRVGDVPGSIDLALFAIPSEAVAKVLAECGEKGARGAIVLSAGFREIGSQGWQREHHLVDIAKEYGMRLIGPNCLGIIDTTIQLNASFASGMPRQGTIAFMSQSGALCTAILDMALADDVGFSRFVSLGNRADVDENALIKAWEHDSHTRVIMVYLEGIEDGTGFMDVASKVGRQKPIIAIKAGTTSAGSRAVSSHTGTLAGTERAYEAAFRQSGVIRAASVQELFDYSIAFARQPLLTGTRIAVVTNAGGPGIMATDACEKAGLQLASLQPNTLEALRTSLPAASSVLNPVDVLGDASANRYEFVLEQILADANVDGVIVILTPQGTTQVEATARAVGELSHRYPKPILGCFMGRSSVEPGIRVLNHFGVPNYPVPERAVAAMQAMLQHHRWKGRPPKQLESFSVDQQRVERLLHRVRSEGRVRIGDAEAREIMEAYGVATPETYLARTPDEAAHFAQQIGFPVVVKIASPDILHKTDVGGVHLSVMSTDDVRDAFEMMVYRAGRFVPGAEIWGCLVQKMVIGGKEVIVGMNRDPHFGPVMLFGLGGIYVEAIRDVSFRIAPLDQRDAYEMVQELQAHNLLRGIRGEPRSDLEAISEALLRFSQLAMDFPEIVEIDINPLIVFQEGQGLTGIDMRLVLE
ncbi:MAG: acetate--CoA ligase family protein [Anaerolineae bacterium]|jgi:acetyltransferase